MKRENQFYEVVKDQQKELADSLPTDDLDARRLALELNQDRLLRDIGREELQERVSKPRAALWKEWLVSYTISRHKK